MRKKKIIRWLLITLAVILGVLVILSITGTVAYAAGLVDNTVSDSNAYSQYPLENYQLDFYVDSSWDWLPWNWLDGIGKSIQYGLYAITNFVWTVSLYISNATGYVVQEAYKLDFISDTANAIGKNIQTLAGITSSGFSSEGFYVGFLLILILVMGIYVTYTGLIKRETTKAVHAVVNFLVVFILSASFIAYAPNYISKINDFSADISSSALSLGTKIVLPDSNSKGKDSVDLIRDSLFSIQVKQPWLLLQYGESDIETLGSDRVESLLSASPDTDDREDIVIKEIEDKDNDNLSVTKTMSRLGTVVFLFIFNIGISIFVFLLTGMMIFSQVLFIIYAMFLPISFILSMIPTYEGMAKKALTKLFNTIMMRAGITLIITTAFSISTMFYSISSGYPFFMIAFLQIVTFAGIYFKLGDLMAMFSLQSSDTQQVSRRIMRRPYMFSLTAEQDAWSVKSEERLRLVLLAVSLVLRLLLPRKRQIMQNQQAAVIPDQTIRHLPIVEVTESRQHYQRIRSRQLCPIKRARKKILQNQKYITVLRARRRRYRILNVVSLIQKRYQNSSNQRSRISKDRWLIRSV